MGKSPPMHTELFSHSKESQQRTADPCHKMQKVWSLQRCTIKKENGCMVKQTGNLVKGMRRRKKLLLLLLLL